MKRFCRIFMILAFMQGAINISASCPELLVDTVYSGLAIKYEYYVLVGEDSEYCYYSRWIPILDETLKF